MYKRLSYKTRDAFYVDTMRVQNSHFQLDLKKKKHFIYLYLRIIFKFITRNFMKLSHLVIVVVAHENKINLVG